MRRGVGGRADRGGGIDLLVRVRQGLRGPLGQPDGLGLGERRVGDFQVPQRIGEPALILGRDSGPPFAWASPSWIRC